MDGVWTYKLEDAIVAIRACYADLCQDVEQKFGQPLRCVTAMGVSAMMHGYLVLDENDTQLATFRT